MGPLDLLLHLLSFMAPAVAVALVVALSSRARLVRQSPRTGWRAQFAINLGVGVAVLAAGLWYFGVDGKMATYAALVLAVATTQWVAGRAWRG